MNKGIIIALVIALAITVIAWLVIHMNRRQPQRNHREMSIKDPATPSRKSAA
jgi:Flp pilus assembly protein CpaB